MPKLLTPSDLNSKSKHWTVLSHAPKVANSKYLMWNVECPRCAKPAILSTHAIMNGGKKNMCQCVLDEIANNAGINRTEALGRVADQITADVYSDVMLLVDNIVLKAANRLGNRMRVQDHITHPVAGGDLIVPVCNTSINMLLSGDSTFENCINILKNILFNSVQEKIEWLAGTIKFPDTYTATLTEIELIQLLSMYRGQR